MVNAAAAFHANRLTPQLLPQIANLWHTFGYFTLSGIISKKTQAELLQLSEVIYMQRRSKSMAELPDTQGAFEGAIWEEFPSISGHLLTQAALDLIQSLLGSQWLYLGSDLSIFAKTGTQAWHRDWNLSLPILKLGYYVTQGKIRKGGEFRIIPGSHRISDSYTSQLNRALAWPSVPTQPGGLNERGFLPMNKDYSTTSATIKFRSRVKRFLLGRNSNAIQDRSFELPHMAVPVGDTSQLLFFDPRSIHSGSVATPAQRRVMFSALFSPNPFDPEFDPKAHGLDVTRDAMAESLGETLILDRMAHNMTTTYHPKGLRPNITSQHLLDLDFSPGEYAITIGENHRVALELPGLAQSPGKDLKEQAWSYMRRLY